MLERQESGKDLHQRRCGCWKSTRPSRWPWYYKPGSWSSWKPISLGGDEWCRWTLVLGLGPITGVLVIPVRQCHGCEDCGPRTLDDRGPNHHYVCPLPTVVIRWVRKSPWDCTCMTDPGAVCPVHEDPQPASEDERVQVAYDALHDATCVDHGEHCRESEPQLKDAIRVMLWRLDGDAR